MPRQSVTATTTVTHTTTVKLAPHVKAMIKARCEEHAQLAAEIKERKGRQDRLRHEVEELFKKADQQQALEDGTVIDGHKIKVVRGSQRTLDRMGLMNAVGLTPEELDSWYDTKPKKAFVKISAPGERDDTE